MEEIISEKKKHFLKAGRLEYKKERAIYICKRDTSLPLLIDPDELVFPWTVLQLPEQPLIKIFPVALPSL